MGLRVYEPRRAFICFIILNRVFSQDNSEEENQHTNELAEGEVENESLNIPQNTQESLNTDEHFTIESIGCTIPSLDILDPSIRHLVNYPSNVLSCSHNTYPLIDKNETHIWVKTQKLPVYNISEESFSCSYKSFHLFNLKTDELKATEPNSRVTYMESVNFTKLVAVNDEFVRVTCHSDEKEIYDQFFVFTQKKNDSVYREKPFEDANNQYNVVIMGVGSMSRLNFHRTMPNTLNLLEEKGAIELLGYNNVANAKVLNLIPILLGMDDKELARTCGRDAFSTVNTSRCTFIWERFKNVGYYTALGEDTGFDTVSSKQIEYFSSPTDYYLRPFILESKRIFGNHTLCLKGTYYFQVMLDYIKSLTSTLQADKLFGLFWESSLSYKDWNSPMIMDHRYEALIKDLDSSDYLNNTILILLSDHGTNFGKFVKTTQGRLEEKLPFVSILTPPSFRDTFSTAYENLKRNAGFLTAPFDIHHTLVDLIDLNSIEDEELLRRSNTPYAVAGGISLFLPIPSNRTCSTAGIETHWCSCIQSKQIFVECRTSRQAAEFMIHELNVLLSSHPQCGKLSVDEILEAKEWLNRFEFLADWRDVTVKVRAVPGGGLFRATLRIDLKNQWSLIGTISRINRTDDESTSTCITDRQLQNYCYCI